MGKGKRLTENEAKSVLFKCCVKHGISPRIVSLYLLSKEDKEDLMCGRLDFESLCLHVDVWKANGCPDYCELDREPPASTEGQ